jgi:MFS family permease
MADLLIMLQSLAPLRNRNFRLLWLAYLVSTMGDVFLEIGIMVTVYERTGSALKTVSVTVAMLLPRFLAGPFAGAWVDRYSRRKIMVGADLLSAALVSVLLLVDTTHLPLLYVVVVGLALVSPLRRPARMALLPMLMPRRDLVAANSLMLATQQAAQACGYALGGVFILKLGFETLVAIDLASFLLAGVAVMFIRIPGGETVAQKVVEPLYRAIAEGLAYLRRHELARPLVALEVMENLPHGIWTPALMLVFTQRALGGDADSWGYQNGVFFTSTLVGATLAIGVSGLVARRPGWAIIVDGFVGGVFTLGYALSPSLGAALLFCALMGPAVALRDVAQDSLLQVSVDNRFMGRVQAMRSMGAQLLFMAGGALFAWLADQIDVRWIYVIGGALYMLVGCYALSKRALRHSRIET